jgi:Protein of unknown function, DUF481
VLLRVVLVIGLLSGPAFAQIVNIQGALAKAPATDGTSGEVSLKLAWREGNTPLLEVGGSGAVLVRHGRILGLALARGEYGRSHDVTLSEKTFEHVRTRITLDCRWEWEAFVQHEFDRFRRLSLRAVAGTGPALHLVDRPEVGVLAGAAYLFELEHLDERDGAVDRGRDSVAHRASLYVTGHEDLSKSVAIVETFYVQPRLDRPSDLRLLGELAVQTKLSSRIALKDSFVIAYDASPPDQVKRLDTALEVSLLVSI